MTALAPNSGIGDTKAGLRSACVTIATGTSIRGDVGSRDGGCTESAISYKYPLDTLVNNRQTGPLIGVAWKVMGGCPWTKQS